MGSKVIVRRTARIVVAVAIFAGVAVSVPARPAVGASQAPGTWAATGAMSRARGFAPLVRLGDGSVLTAGGTDGASFTATAERWTTSGRTWTPAGSIGQAVAGGVAALLPNGKAIFAGGAGDESYYGYGDLYDPSGGTWTQTPAMVHVHAYGAAAQLSNGDLVVIGGMDGSVAMTTNAVDVYSASGNAWSPGSALPGAGRYALTATTMTDGSILVAGGNDGTSGGSAAMSAVAIYSGGSWTAADSMSTARFDHAAVRLQDGRILVVGGSDSSGTALSGAEIYDPSTHDWSATGSLATPRYGATLTLLGNGWALVTGGFASAGSPALSSAEIYDPGTGSWTSAGFMGYGRRYHSAVLLADGTVLVAGGHASDNDYYLNTAEVYAPPLSYPATTFHPLQPTRIMDTRTGLGLTGKFTDRVPRLLTVVGTAGVPASAIAVTGIVTVTNQTTAGYISVGPTPTKAPTSSTLNYPYGDNRANNVTVALDTSGRLGFVMCCSGSTDLIFDVTGWFAADGSGATWVPLAAPARVMDSRSGVGLSGPGAYVTKSPKTTTIWGAGGVPSGAVAVTGNLTVVGPSSGGWAFAGPSIPADPATLNASMVNAQKGEIKADGVTVQLSATGTLSFVWVGGTGSTAHMVFDVTGYFVNGPGGAWFVPMDPLRVADTRIGLPVQGPVKMASPVAVPIAGRGHIPWAAVGMSGNLTVVGQSAAGYLTAAPVAPSTPPETSTLNFPAGDIRANGFDVRLNHDVGLAPDGTVGIVYFPTAGSSTHFVLDVTGYFI